MNLEQKAQDYLLAHQGDSTVSVMVGFAEELAAGSGWVSVEDRLPDEANLYVGIMAPNPKFVLEPDIFWYNGEYFPHYLNILRWMPIPAYPEFGKRIDSPKEKQK